MPEHQPHSYANEHAPDESFPPFTAGQAAEIKAIAGEGATGVKSINGKEGVVINALFNEAGTVPATVLKAGEITGAQIAALTIKASNIEAATITGAKIAAGTIEGGNIKAEAIVGAAIAKETITGEKIAPLTIPAAAIGGEAVSEAKIKANSVSGTKIKVNAAEAPKELKENTSIENSATSVTTVYLSILFNPEETVGEIIVDGVSLYKIRKETLAASSDNAWFSFRMKGGAKFEVKMTTGKIATEGVAKSVYTFQEG